MGFGEILLTTNAPPSTGKLIVSPPNGTAVLTTFSISASSWIDDDLPLSYVFMYSLSDDQGDLTLAAKSQMTFTSSPLPAGLNSMNGIVNNCSLDFLNFSAINVLVCCCTNWTYFNVCLCLSVWLSDCLSVCLTICLTRNRACKSWNLGCSRSFHSSYCKCPCSKSRYLCRTGIVLCVDHS